MYSWFAHVHVVISLECRICTSYRWSLEPFLTALNVAGASSSLKSLGSSVQITSLSWINLLTELQWNNCYWEFLLALHCTFQRQIAKSHVEDHSRATILAAYAYACDEVFAIQVFGFLTEF